MLIKSQTISHIRSEFEKELQNVSEIVFTNFGTSTAYINGRTVKPGWSITFMKGVFTQSIWIKIWFDNDGQTNEAELSYLKKENDN